ncbi:hypothetical protein XENORESO_021703 [Xenotaenia resolanae]|uniref:Uncharacterized protein n=1 Tax=Xenotaenia resolanae TaxID=208358 RepID=A0ABV0X5N1_9TELE
MFKVVYNPVLYRNMFARQYFHAVFPYLYMREAPMAAKNRQVLVHPDEDSPTRGQRPCIKKYSPGKRRWKDLLSCSCWITSGFEDRNEPKSCGPVPDRLYKSSHRWTLLVCQRGRTGCTRRIFDLWVV